MSARTLYVVRLPDNRRAVTRTVLATAHEVADGGMYEYRDPLTDAVVGSSGRNWHKANAMTIFEYTHELTRLRLEHHKALKESEAESD